MKYITVFVLPIIVFLGVIEIVLHTIPNSYSYKYNYVRTHGDEIKAVGIGHSQLYDDFKSGCFFISAFNLSNSAQGYMEDYYLLHELLSYMPNLEMVILPIGYMNVGREEEFTQKSCYYYEYMNIDYDGKIPLQYRFECLSVRSSIKKVFSYYIKHDDIVRCDSLGWSPHYYKDREKALGHDRIIDIYTLGENNFFLAGEMYLKRIIRLLDENNIKIVLVSPPYYWDCYDNINWAQKTWSDMYIKNLCETNPQIQYINMEFDSTFYDEDYYDESHLSETGAEKFTHKLNDFILSKNVK